MNAWLGGRQRCFQRPDAVCIGATHSAFPIDATLRDQWLGCVNLALDAIDAPVALQRSIRPPLAALADVLRNR